MTFRDGELELRKMVNKLRENEIITVTKASLPEFREYEELISKLWENRWLTNMGMYHEELKEKLKSYLEVGGVELFVNGHMALEMLIQAFELEGEVITTPFTFASTTHAIVRNGLKPVFCDIDPDDCTIDASKIESLITKDTCAILPVHVYGNICDFKTIEGIAKEHGLKLIFDAAHAFGESVGGIPVGELGDASMFSFHATKVFNTIEGGAVTWKGENRELSEKLYKLKNFGITGKESVEYVGGNAKMNEFCAAMGLCNLRHVNDWISERKAVYDRYVRNLGHVRGIRLLGRREDTVYNYAYMPVVFDGNIFKRNEIYEKLMGENIYSRKYFYPCVNAYDCYRGSYDSKETPIAFELSENILTLPIYPELSAEDVDRICEIIVG